ncbi:hypothetical protein CEP53_007378 [Fusarium sp. AF-6]|nr:hypothetical protein CEP53_007378 [Fusarium sp. AF-6]
MNSDGAHAYTKHILCEAVDANQDPLDIRPFVDATISSYPSLRKPEIYGDLVKQGPKLHALVSEVRQRLNTAPERVDDPYELTNLADSTDPHIQRVKSRLNALLLVTKSCAEASCRDPWSVIQPPRQRRGKKVKTLDDAMDPAFDDFYSSFPLVNIEECLTYQLAKNEGPFYPPKAEFGLGLKHRKSTDNFVSLDADPVKKVEKNNPLGGGLNHRHSTYEQLMKSAHELTDEELEQAEED